MMEEFSRLKPRITQAVEACLEKAGHDFAAVNTWAGDCTRRIGDYTGRGKMIRGGLVSVGARAFSPEPWNGDSALSHEAIQTGAAMELLQSLLLIHDDIMDQDDLRRGKPSLHAQYQALAGHAGLRDPGRCGESMAICGGDASGFLAMGLLAGLNLAPAIHRPLLQLVSRELTLVVFAQMGDVWNGVAPTEPGFDDILRLYRYKTGRYTFSLPLMAGALLAQARPIIQEELAELGELLGILFQIQDDEIGLFGSTEQTGKPSGTDIRENKKTLHRHFLLERADVSERKRLLAIFGNPSAGTAELGFVQAAMEANGVRQSITSELEFYAGQAAERIARLPGLNEWGRRMLEAIVAWNRTRAG